MFGPGKDILAIALPMLGTADSLNVSITAAVLLYEALRQRRDATGCLQAVGYASA